MLTRLRGQLTLFNSIILICFMAFFITIIYFTVYNMLMVRMDRLLELYAASVVKATSTPDNYYALPGLRHHRIEIHTLSFDKSGINYIIRGSGLKPVQQSNSHEGLEALTRQTAAQASLTMRPSWTTIKYQGERLRLYSAPCMYNGRPAIIQTYRSLELERDIFENLIGKLLILGLAASGILGFIGWVLAGKALIPVQRSWRQQREFVADASHELRTPLTVIQTNLEVALADQQGTIADNNKWLDTAYTETSKMARLLNDLLLLARVDAKEIELEAQPLSLSRLARDTAQAMTPLFTGKNIHFGYEIADEVSIMGDEVRIRQLLMILLDNALKYTPEGGTVAVKVHKTGNHALIRVEDSGIGIPEQDRERVFDRFYRVDKSRSGVKESSGLGLSIARWIAAAHGGSIQVDSQLGKGSVFTVELPCQPAG